MTEELRGIISRNGKIVPDEKFNREGKEAEGDGFIVYRFVKNDPQERHFAEMRRIYVVENKRRKGIATKLMKHFEKLAKKEGHTRVLIRAFPEDGNPFFTALEKWGYKPHTKRFSDYQWKKIL